ncbi:hypothetical protein [Aquimarina aquimarini]|uniref:hypothetical protein n=1 Tax=Aquimarina aquimarini TaxID=1191734 RepID=UPI00131ED7CD|nr:hypothetical protein [Aquimarina aquimarini]
MNLFDDLALGCIAKRIMNYSEVCVDKPGNLYGTSNIEKERFKLKEEVMKKTPELI